MKLSFIFLAIGLLCLAVFGEDPVVTLDDAGFDDYIEEHPRVLVEFYAPWCGHCKALEPEYKKAAQQLKEEGATTILAKVDATVEKNLASRFQIRGFPTLKYFTGDKNVPSEYGGGRTTDTIVSWIKKREKPAITFLTDATETTNFQKSRVTLVGYFAKDAPEASVLSKLAEKFRDELVTGQVTTKSVAEELGVGFPSLYLYTNFEGDDSKTVQYEGDATDESAVMKFISSERFPVIDQIGPDNYQSYMDRGVPLVWIPLDPSDQTTKVEVIKTLTPFAKKFKGKLSFTWIDSVQYKQYVDNLGISEGGFLVQTTDGASKWKYEGDYSDEEKLNKFFEQYDSGNLEKYLKSEPVPEKNDKPVYVLVGKNFDDVVGKEKDVFVEFYAPWCGHCKKLAPEYEKVGEAFQDVDDLVVAKIDATQNDSREQIQGFPTLIFYPRGQNEGIKYEGDRTAEAIIDWLKDKSSADVSSVESKTEL